MNLSGRLAQIQSVYKEYPSQFWIIVVGTFIDRLGGALMFPFFTLYLTRKFGIGMTQVGVIFMLFSISSVVGSFIGGALTDRWGRKGMLLFGLVMSALSSLLMGVVNEIQLFFLVALIVGVLTDVGGPAQQALIADLLPEEQRAQGFGILRVVVNLAVTIGPMIGGLLAARSYLLLFIVDAITSMITAIFIFFTLKETYVPVTVDQEQPNLTQTFRGYLDVLRDNAFVWFLGASVLMVLVYMQMNTTLAVYLRDVHGISEQGFGFIVSLNAAMVVLFQFGITRRITRFNPLTIMAAGTVLYALGFAMYGFVGTYVLFLVAMAIITIGEMLVSPVGQAIIARLAPEDMRGRYMATFGFSWVIPTAIGPLLAGIVMDHFDPRWVWYLAGILALAAAAAYYLLEVRVGSSRWSAVEERLAIIEQLEERQISAEEAARRLEKVGEGTWARLIPAQEVQPRPAHRLVHIQVSDLNTGAMKVDLHLPVGLVNTVLVVGGHLSADLDSIHVEHLRRIMASHGSGNHQIDSGDEHLDVSID